LKQTITVSWNGPPDTGHMVLTDKDGNDVTIEIHVLDNTNIKWTADRTSVRKVAIQFHQEVDGVNDTPTGYFHRVVLKRDPHGNGAKNFASTKFRARGDSQPRTWKYFVFVELKDPDGTFKMLDPKIRNDGAVMRFIEDTREGA